MSSGDELDTETTGRLAGRGRKGRGLRPRQRHVLRIKDGRQEVSQRQMEGWRAGGRGEHVNTEAGRQARDTGSNLGN